MSEAAPERVIVEPDYDHDWAYPRGEWFIKSSDLVGDYGVEYVRKDIHDISQTERHADGEYIGHLQARVEELEAALERIAGKNDLSGVPDGHVCSAARLSLYDCEMIARAALTPPEQQ